MDSSFFNEAKRVFKAWDMLMRIIAVNVAVFVLYHVIHLFFILFAIEDRFTIGAWLAAPADVSELVRRPWTVVSYMFFHTEWLHILFNMLWLFWFGRIFRRYFDRNLLFNVYLLGGLAGVFLYVFSYNVFPVFSLARHTSVLLGASAGVLAVVTGIACYVPNYKINLLFFGPVRLIYIAVASIVLDLVSISMNENMGGNIAHLGGAFFGWIFAVNIRRRKDITSWLTRLRTTCRSWFRKKPKLKVHYHETPASDWDYNKQKKEQQEEIDYILDKISKGGYESLTQREKEILFRQKK
ncbi:MAG: rhomboid family intramembrane serine protease [Bacteroidales bacterium]|jgi:membrane associated rhomboid family serine protease|nr:rhomboid family intramembrane serine protease [Bacteroidales bacterium]